MDEYFFILTIQVDGKRLTHIGFSEANKPSSIFKEAQADAVRKFNLSSRDMVTVEFFRFWQE